MLDDGIFPNLQMEVTVMEFEKDLHFINIHFLALLQSFMCKWNITSFVVGCSAP